MYIQLNSFFKNEQLGSISFYASLKFPIQKLTIFGIVSIHISLYLHAICQLRDN